MIEYPKYKSLGMHVGDVVRDMIDTATEHGQPVRIDFNGIELIAQPGGSADDLARYYHEESDRRRAAWLASPEYAEQQRKYAQAQRKAEADRAAALAASPHRMSLRDAEGWAECQRVNSDGYGAAACRYAEMWARIMEGMIAGGHSVSSCADRAATLADEEGITGFMYGCAVLILSEVWTHGEDLRKWHNLKTQIGDEGERANESGGVLNPALLSIS